MHGSRHQIAAAGTGILEQIEQRSVTLNIRLRQRLKLDVLRVRNSNEDFWGEMDGAANIATR